MHCTLVYVTVNFIRGFKEKWGVSSDLCVSAAGYYYELDDSYDESDEEEVRAHLRRVAEQPPLKLDDSTEVKHLPTHEPSVFSLMEAHCAQALMTKHCRTIIIFFFLILIIHLSAQKLEFLGAFSLTTVGRRDELVQQKRRKRRRMLRERSPSPPALHSKRTPPPPPQLSTRFTPEEMDRAPELEDKKRFLTMFRLSHVTIQQRRGKKGLQ